MARKNATQGNGGEAATQEETMIGSVDTGASVAPTQEGGEADTLAPVALTTQDAPPVATEGGEGGEAAIILATEGGEAATEGGEDAPPVAPVAVDYCDPAVAIAVGNGRGETFHVSPDGTVKIARDVAPDTLAVVDSSTVIQWARGEADRIRREARIAAIIALSVEKGETEGRIAALLSREESALAVMADRKADRAARLAAMEDNDTIAAALDSERAALAATEGKIAALAAFVADALAVMRGNLGDGIAALVNTVNEVLNGEDAPDALALGEAIASLIARARHFNGIAALASQKELMIGSILASPFSARRKSGGAATGGEAATEGGERTANGGDSLYKIDDQGNIYGMIIPFAQWEIVGGAFPDDAILNHNRKHGGAMGARSGGLKVTQRAAVAASLDRIAALATDSGDKATAQKWADRIRLAPVAPVAPTQEGGEAATQEGEGK